MGLPLYKPKEDCKEETTKHQQAEDIENEEFWSIIPQRLIQNAIHHTRRPTSRHQHNSPASSFATNYMSTRLTQSAIFQPRMRSRLSRRPAMLAASLMDRRRNSRVHQLPSTSSTSPPVRNELDRRLQQRIDEKVDILEQLRVTVSLLDQFLSARAALGSEMMALPSFITEDLPAVLESASSLADMVPTYLAPSSPTETVIEHASTNSNDVHDMVERLLQIPPYSSRIQNIEQNIISTQRRIREQISQLEWGFASSPTLPGVTPTEITTENRNPSSVTPILRRPRLEESFIEYTDS